MFDSSAMSVYNRDSAEPTETQARMVMEAGYLLNNRYKLLQGIGMGPLTIVYEAHDTALDRLVAVKVLRLEYTVQREVAHRFLQEGQRIAELSHPNLTAVYEVSNDGETPYLVTEYLPAGSLRDRLDRNGTLTVDRALDIATAIAAGVGAFHAQDILHGDLKPQNVLFTEQEIAKVTDGGMGRVLATALKGEAAPLREPAAYLTPEEVAGRSLTPASDVYAIGLTFYEMLAGRPPFLAKTPSETALMHLRQEAPPIQEHNPRVPTPLARIIQKTMAKDLGARYTSAQQLHQILFSYQRQRAGLNRRATPAVFAMPQAERPEEPLEPALAGPHHTLPNGGDEEYTEEGVDWLLIFLGLLVVLAVLGVVILWNIVYHRYTTPLG